MNSTNSSLPLFHLKSLLSLGHGNHERDGYHRNQNADNNVRRKRFAEDECPYQDGRNGLEDAEHGSLGRPDVAGGNGQRGGGHDGGQQGEPHQVQPGRGGCEAGRYPRIGHDNLTQKDKGAYRKGVKGEEAVRNVDDDFAAVDDDNEQRIHQSRGEGEQKAYGIDRLRRIALRHDDHPHERQADGEPHRPRGNYLQKDHDDGHQDRIEENDGRGQTRSDVLICLEQGKAAGRIEQSQHEQHARLLPRHLEALLAQQKECPQKQHRDGIAEKEDGFYRSAFLHQRDGK